MLRVFRTPFRVASQTTRQKFLHQELTKCPCQLSKTIPTSGTSPLLTARGFATLGPAPSAVGFNDYEEGCREFSLEVPERFNFARDVIDKWAQIEEEDPDPEGKLEHLALWWTSDSGMEYKWSFKQLSAYSKRTAYVLTGPCGLEKGDRIMCVLPPFPQYWLLYLACIRAGLIFMPASPFHSAEEILFRTSIASPVCLITENESLDKVDKIIGRCPSVKTKMFVPRSRAVHRKLGWLNFADLYKTSKRMRLDCEDTKSDETMTIFFSTGTTGDPKMVEHTHSSYGLGSLVTGKYWLDLTRQDIHWNLADPGWAKSAWSSVFGPWLQGACVFVHSATDPTSGQILRALEKYPITTFCTSPPEYRKLILKDLTQYNLQTLRHCTSSGELLNPDIIEKWEEGTGVVIREGFGQTETVLACGNFRCLTPRLGSMGKAAPGFNVVVVNEDLEEMPPGEQGTIAVKLKPHPPPGLFIGYTDDPVKTAAVFQGDYYLTGDQGYIDEDGYVWFISRADDIIYTDGQMVSPFDVESALMDHPAVAECAVVSSPDSLQLTGQIVKAFITLTKDYVRVDEEELLDMLHEHTAECLEPYQRPQQYELMKELPKTVTGKIKRVDLRKQEWNFQASDSDSDN